MNADFDQLWELMSPEEQNQLLAMGTLDQRQGMLDRQMQQAELLRQGSNQKYSTGLGAALGGLANVVQAGQGQYQLEQAQQGMDDLLAQQDEGRILYGDLMQRFGRQRAQQAQPPTPDVTPALPFSF